jgi:hypothetical protein
LVFFRPNIFIASGIVLHGVIDQTPATHLTIEYLKLLNVTTGQHLIIMILIR